MKIISVFLTLGCQTLSLINSQRHDSKLGETIYKLAYYMFFFFLSFSCICDITTNSSSYFFHHTLSGCYINVFVLFWSHRADIGYQAVTNPHQSLLCLHSKHPRLLKILANVFMAFFQKSNICSSSDSSPTKHTCLCGHKLLFKQAVLTF